MMETGVDASGAQLKPLASVPATGAMAAKRSALSKPREIAIVGDPEAADTQALLNIVRDGYRPFQVVALGLAGAQPPAVPLLQHRGLRDGRAVAYVCRNFTSQAPVTEAEESQGLPGS